MTWTLDSTAATLDSTGYTMDGGTPGSGGNFAATTLAAVASMPATLVPWASVVLTAPLYQGLGGALDGYLWTSPLPQVGTTLYYDPTFITIAANGEITSTSNNITALIGFYANGVWTQALYTLSPTFVSYGPAQASLTGTLSGASIPLSGAATALASLTPQLSTTVQVGALAAAQASASAALSAAARFQTQGTAVATMTAALGTAASFASSANAQALLSAQLSSGVALAAAPGAVAGLSAALSNAIRFNVAAGAKATLTGSIASAAGLASQLRALASIGAALSTKIPVAAAANAKASLSATLLIPKPLQASASGLASATAAIRTGSGFTASMGAEATLTAGALQTAASFAVIMPAIASLNANLTTEPVLTTPVLVSHQIPGIYQPGSVPFGQFELPAGEKSVYAIDWTYWIAFLWQPGLNAIAAQTVIRPFPWTGYQYICATSGQTGNYPPVWPQELGALVVDGSAVWQAQAIDATSLQTSVQSASYATPPGIVASSYLTQNNMTPVLIDATAATPGNTYEVVCTAYMASGDFLIGQYVFNVR